MASNDSNEPVDILHRLLVGLPTETTAQLLRVVHESKQRARGVDPGGNPKDVLFDLARISLKGQEELIKLGARGLDQVADALCSSGGPVESGKPSRLRLRTSVWAGDSAVAGFKVTNPFSERVDVSFTQPKLRDGSGRELPGDVSFARAVGDRRDPNDFALESGQTGRFELLLSAAAEAGGRYSGESYVVVGARVVGHLLIEADVRPPSNVREETIEVAIGEEKVLRLPIQNPFRNRRGTVHFSETGFTAPNGAEFPGSLELQPEREGSMDIGPGESRPFELVVELEEKESQPCYFGKAYVLVDERVALHLSLRILVKGAAS